MPAQATERASVKVTGETHERLRQAAEFHGTSIQDLVGRLVTDHLDQLLLDSMNDAFAAANTRPEASDERAEREAWDNVLLDDLEDES